MSKKVTIELRTPVRVRDRDMHLLAAVDELSKRSGVMVSLGELARKLGCAIDTARRAVLSCADEGYLDVKPMHREDGGQLANFYSLTASGRRVLSAAREAGIV